MRQYLAILLLVSLVGVVTCRTNQILQQQQPLPDVPRVPAPPDLGQRAYHHVETLVGFGPRHSGAPGWHRSVDYIAASLREAGLEPVRDRWTEPEFDIVFENIHATIPGRHPDRIVIACHHDTKCCEGHDDPEHNFRFVGANDSGSGVGLLLALAQTLADTTPDATLQVVFFDGEESLEFKWNLEHALFGSRRFAKRHAAERAVDPSSPPIRALILLDMVGATDLSIDEETNSSADLRLLFRAAARACGHSKAFFRHEMSVTDDHFPFLDLDIPAIDLIDIYDNPQWHSADDTLEHISADSLQIVGEVVMAALPAIATRYLPAARPPGGDDR